MKSLVRKPVILVLASTYPRWANDPEPGFVHELCRRMVEHFHVIALVPDAAGADPSGEMDGVEVIRYRYAPRSLQTLVNHGGIATNLKMSRWKWLLVPSFIAASWLVARKLVRERHVAVIHAHWLIPQGLVARALGKKGRVPYVVTSHGGDLYGFRAKLLTRIKRAVTADAVAVTVVSAAMKEEVQRIHLPVKEIHVLPMGVDMHQRFTLDPSVERAENVILFVGRLVPKKGVSHLLAAMKIISSKRQDVLLEIAGFGPDEAALRAQVIELDISNKVRFLGATPQMQLPSMYRKASMLVAPFVADTSGNQEGLPVVVMEAVGCGCPVVVGDVDGARELLGADGQCVNASDSNALSAAVLRVLDDPSSAKAQALVLRRRLAGRLDWSVIAKGYAEIIAGAVESQKKSLRGAHL
jgi:glycosyltransferase involved in cell wall biosynthesis